MQGDKLGHHWEILSSLLPLYQAITSVKLEDGRSTLFWTDVWWEDETFEDRFPRLFSHCSNKTCTVKQAVISDLQGCFVNRLSAEAQLELYSTYVPLFSSNSSRTSQIKDSTFSRGNDKLDTSAIYRLLKAKGQENDPASSFIWRNAAPPRVQLFFWLLMRGRIQCRSNLYCKKIVDSPDCEICGSGMETPDHIIFQCPIAISFWEAIGLQSCHILQNRN